MYDMYDMEESHTSYVSGGRLGTHILMAFQCKSNARIPMVGIGETLESYANAVSMCTLECRQLEIHWNVISILPI